MEIVQLVYTLFLLSLVFMHHTGKQMLEGMIIFNYILSIGLLTKLVWSRWLDIGHLFCVFIDRDRVEVCKLAKKNEPNIKDLCVALGEIFLAGHCRLSQAGQIAPSCLVE